MSLIPFFSQNTPIFTWFLMETNVMVFLFMNYMMQSPKNMDFFCHDNYFLYFKVQSLSSFAFLGSNLLTFVSFDSLSSYLPGGGLVVLLCSLSLAAKIGLPPFHYWFYSFCSKQINPSCLLLLLTFQKLPLFGILCSLSAAHSAFWGVISLTLGSLFILSSKSMLSLMVSSSIFNSFWFVMFFMLGPSYVTFFFLFYFFSVLVMVLIYTNQLISYNKPQFKGLLSTLVVFFLMGVPPMSAFFFKSVLISSMMIFFSIPELYFIFFFMFIGFCGYLSYFYSMFLGFDQFYMNFPRISLWYMIFFFFFFFFF